MRCGPLSAGSKKQPRWLWEALDHQTGQILAYVFGRREDREAHSLAASPPTPEERPSYGRTESEQTCTLSPSNTRRSFAPDYRRVRSLRLRAGGRPRRATPPPSR